MSIVQAFDDAEITRILIVDDDLSPVISLANLDDQGGGLRISAILADGDHDITHALDQSLQRLGHPHGTAAERAGALADPVVLAATDPQLRAAYEAAVEYRAAFKAPLEKIKEWIKEGGRQVTIEEWHQSAALSANDRYDLLVIDYYLVNNSPDSTMELIKEFKAAHAQQPKPLLVILMSSNISVIERDFETIRDNCQMSASRFRILAKPVETNQDPDILVRERWIRALKQLANERILVAPIERFVLAWEKSLHDATRQMIQRLYDLDASAFAMLAATAKRDSMTIEEYTADILSRRISAETEEMSFPFEEITALETALNSAQGSISPTIDQGVEVRHAQRAIRSLMSDVIWHRSPWWTPRSLLPARLQVVADQAVVSIVDATVPQSMVTGIPATSLRATADAVAAEAAPPHMRVETAEPINDVADAMTPAAERTLTQAECNQRDEARLTWMKRHIRFGTIIRQGASGHFYVNLTQACDVQSEQLCNLNEVHYLFIQGAKFPVDRVAVGEKAVDSPYYCENLESDEFFALQWRLRQPFTPTMASMLKTLEEFPIVGQLRNDSAYAVLAKYTSQASRVAQIRMPKVFRYAVSIYHKSDASSWTKQAVDPAIEASAWQKDDKDWRLQFSVSAAQALLHYLSGVLDAKKEELTSTLIAGLKVETSSNSLLHARLIKDTTVVLIRLDGKASYESAALDAQLSANDKCKAAAVGATLILTQAKY